VHNLFGRRASEALGQMGATPVQMVGQLRRGQQRSGGKGGRECRVLLPWCADRLGEPGAEGVAPGIGQGVEGAVALAAGVNADEAVTLQRCERLVDAVARADVDDGRLFRGEEESIHGVGVQRAGGQERQQQKSQR
jgi:hypothetical protein